MKNIAYSLLETLTIVALYGGIGWLILDSWRIILKHALAVMVPKRKRGTESCNEEYRDTEEIQ